MRIVVLSNLYPPDVIGGYEIACAQAVDALRERGHDVLVLTGAPRRPVATPGHVRRVFQLADTWNHHLNAKTDYLALRQLFADAAFVNAFNVHALGAEIAAFRPDVAYIHNVFGLGGLGLIAALGQLGVPWLWQLGDDVPAMLCRDLGRLIPELAAEFGRQAKGSFVAVSSRVVEEIERSGIELNGPVEIIPYWVAGEARPLDRLYMPDGILRVVSAGRMVPEKGIDRLIEAVANLRDEGVTNITLDLYGNAEDEGRYPTLVSRLGLEDRVRLMGFVPHAELYRRYAEYDVLAFPTWEREPFGLVPLEAAVQGACAPLISRSCGVAEWLVHGVHCVKVGLGAGSLERGLRDMAEGAVDLAAMGARARRAAWRDMHIDSIAPRLEDLLRAAAFGGDAGRDEEAAPREISPRAVDEAYRMALLGERLTQVLMTEAVHG